MNICWLLRVAFLASTFLLRCYAQDAIQWTTNFYSIAGVTLAEMNQSIEQARSWKDKSTAHAQTEWRINWRFDVEGSSSGCRVKEFTTKTAITMTMPRWTTSAKASQEVKDAWVRYYKALQEHEIGHCRIALAASAELKKRINALPAESECKVLRQNIEDVCERVMDEFKKRDKEYDERTKHGETQGARLPALLPRRSG